MTLQETYMHRCLQLAKWAQGFVAPNPMVGAVLVYENRIIGEGYHQQYGQAHAEVVCINSVKKEDVPFIHQATLYVSLEPCAHFGKTPPCADLIIQKKIPAVVIGCRDPFVQVNGKGIEKLRAAGIEVTIGVLEKECKELNKRFFTFHMQHRPYVILKWAQTGDRKIAAEASIHQQKASPAKNRLLISNEYTNRIVHQWRSEEMAILVGTNTALLDNPELTVRLWPGNYPVRLVIDMQLQLPSSLKLFDGTVPTIVFNLHQHTLPMEKLSASHLKTIGVEYYQVTEDVSLIHQVLHALYVLSIQSVLVEGGAFLLQSFIDEEAWNEARIITNESLITANGLPAPVLKNEQLTGAEVIAGDSIRTYKHSTI